MNKVLMLLAADRITGPAKGLFQFIRHANGTAWQFIFGFFHLQGLGDVTQCVPEAEALGVPYVVLRQTMRFDPFLVGRTYRAMKEYGVTLLQSHSYKGHLLSLLLRQYTGVPWIAFAHGWTDENRLVRWYNRLDFRVLRHPDRVVAVSDSVRRRLEMGGVPAARIITIPNAVEPLAIVAAASSGCFRASLGISGSTPLLAVIGRFSPEKGQDIFLEACRLVAREMPNFMAVLVGEGPSEGALREQALALGLDGHVKILGYQHNINAIYEDCDLVVIPSRSEGLPNVLLEAMAFGKAVIATEVGGIPEVIQDGINGRLVPSVQPAEMAKAICNLLRECSLRDRISQRARVTVDRFSPAVRAREILKLYADIMTER